MPPGRYAPAYVPPEEETPPVQVDEYSTYADPSTAPAGEPPPPVPEPAPYGPPPSLQTQALGSGSSPNEWTPPPEAGPPPQPTYNTLAGSAPAEPLPKSPSEAGPAAPPVPEAQYGTSAPTGKNIVTSTYPATGTTTVQTKVGSVSPYYPIQVDKTYRTIPPAGSTYPTRETAYGVPPRDWKKLQTYYRRGAYPDLEPRFPGDGPLGQGPPHAPNSRQVPSEVYFSAIKPYFRGEGNMGTRDPMVPYSSVERPLPGIGHYAYGPGETRPEDIWRPGPDSASPYSQGTIDRSRARPENAGHVAPPGYVPEIWGGRGGYESSYWLEKAPEPEVVQEHGPGYTGPYPPEDLSIPEPPPAVGYTRRDTLASMERGRKERRLRGLYGGKR